VLDRPYVLLSCGMSIDGYVDSPSDERLLLSNAADFDRVDEVRAGCDAILVGAGTVRADNPRLLVRSAERQTARRARGKSGNPIKVTLTTTGDLDPHAAFFTAGDAARIVYVPPGTTADLPATIVAADGLPALLEDLARRGVERLLVEGGTAMHTAFLSGGLADELQLAVAPILVGGGTRFVDPATFPPGRLDLLAMDRVGDMAVLTYGKPR
jgi:5-amino-6-(5-phosphoribosylamino)uracil reductase